METTVAEDGTVSLLSNKGFRAAGKTVGEFRLEVQQHYAGEFKSVQVMCGYPGAFYHIGGEVRCPGEMIFEDQTLTHAILGAGGFTPSANKKKVRVISRDGQSRVIDCSRMEGVMGGEVGRRMSNSCIVTIFTSPVYPNGRSGEETKLRA
jgi:protein involved in polysaccharide export with SLBB domain